MKPDFALSLSFEGIDLLVRAAGGWRTAGQVGLQSDDLVSALADLRQKAVDLGGAAFRTKLIIPKDQIRFLSVETGHVSTADRIEQVRTALDGATPYAVADLVYDICVDGPLTHVAAVARDTLEEAESFAIEHRFQPVSFVAIPGDEAFLGEPFFGPTSYASTALASGERVEPDGIAVVIVGPVEEAPSAENGGQPSDPPDTADPATPPDAQNDPSDDADTAAPQETIRQPDAPVDTAPATETPAEDPVAPDPVAPPDPEDSQDTTGAGAPEPPPSGFASRRASSTAAPALGGAKKSDASTIAPSIELDDVGETNPPPKRLFASLAPTELELDDKDAQKTWASRFMSRRSTDAGPADTVVEPPKPVARPVQAPKPASPPQVAAKPVETTSPIAGFATPRGAKPNRSSKKQAPDEKERMTIFGMRETGKTGGAPKHLGLILTAVLLVFLAGVAAWAALFLDEEIAAWFERDDDLIVADVPETVTVLPTEPEVTTTEDLASLNTGLTETDAAVLEALRDPAPAQGSLLPDQRTAEAHYAVTGVWQRAPEPPTGPGIIGLDDLYVTSIDAAVDARDAIALLPADRFTTDQPMGQVISPVGPGSEFAFDDNGRVIPTPEGALSPDGFTVFLGRPPVVPPETPDRAPAVEEPADADITASLAEVRPRIRPTDLVEQSERSQLGGLTLSELSGVRPLLRPETEKSAEEEDQTPTAQAVLASITPSARPSNIGELVENATQTDPTEEDAQTQVASAAAVAPATVTPSIPSSASVARAATVENAINLNRVNLIGVYGTQADRRALVRLPNGRYRKVQVGDRLDGGSISAIGDAELRYQKNGRNLTLNIPSG